LLCGLYLNKNEIGGKDVGTPERTESWSFNELLREVVINLRYYFLCNQTGKYEENILSSHPSL
jgi:hypothetical protein